MNRLLAVAAVTVLLLGGVYAVGFTGATHTTVVARFTQACFLLDSAGHIATNGTLTFFNVPPVTGSTIARNYSVINLSPATRSLTGITAVPDASAALNASITGIAFPVSLLSRGTAPFTMTLTVTAQAINVMNATVVVTATCV